MCPAPGMQKVLDEHSPLAGGAPVCPSSLAPSNSPAPSRVVCILTTTESFTTQSAELELSYRETPAELKPPAGHPVPTRRASSTCAHWTDGPTPQAASHSEPPSPPSQPGSLISQLTSGDFSGLLIPGVKARGISEAQRVRVRLAQDGRWPRAGELPTPGHQGPVRRVSNRQVGNSREGAASRRGISLSPLEAPPLRTPGSLSLWVRTPVMRTSTVMFPFPGETAFTATFGELLPNLLGPGSGPPAGGAPPGPRRAGLSSPWSSAFWSGLWNSTQHGGCRLPTFGCPRGQAGAVRCSKMTKKDTLPNAHSIRASKSPLCRPNEMGLTAGEQHRAVCTGSFASLPLATENRRTHLIPLTWHRAGAWPGRKPSAGRSRGQAGGPGAALQGGCP